MEYLILNGRPALHSLNIFNSRQLCRDFISPVCIHHALAGQHPIAERSG